MRDFLPADVRKRNYVINIIKEVYESYGFEPLETPAVENIETLTGKYGEEGNQLIYRVLTRGGKFDEGLTTLRNRLAHGSSDWVEVPFDLRHLARRELADLALRYDLTVPLARVVADNKNELPKFFKRYQIQPVWRADRPARGRFREFYQCDVDAMGSESLVIEIEQIAAVSKVLQCLGFTDFVIRINHRSVLAGLLNAFGIETHKHEEALVALDKLDKLGLEGVQKELASREIEPASSTQLTSLMDFFNKDQLGKKMTDRSQLGVAELTSYVSSLQTPAGMIPLDSPLGIDIVAENQDAFKAVENEKLILSNLRAFLGLNSTLQLDKTAMIAVNQLRRIWKEVNSLGLANHIRIDPSLARGLSYYTGAIMEINVQGIGSLGGGGRYDGLIGMFGKEQIPACGFSLGLERILVVMEERGMFPAEIAESAPADVMVTIGSEETIADSLRLASELRATGLRVTVYPQADKEDKQWKYANSIGVPWLCTVNEIDIAEKAVSFQDLRSRERYREPLETAAARMRGE